MAFAQGGELGEFGIGALDERLATESGVYAHEHDDIDVFDDVLEHADGRRGVEDDAGLDAAVVQMGDEPMRVARGLDVEGDEVGAGIDEPVRMVVRVLDHEMDVQGNVGSALARRDDGHPVGEVGGELPVDDIDVDVVGVAHGMEVAGEVREIGGHDGR